MATFITDLMNSIFVAGPTPSIIVATNASFAALQLVLFCLLVATYSIHFLVLSGLCAGLWWSINWFVAELRESQRIEDEKKKKSQGQEAVNGDDSDTEQENVVQVGGRSSGSREVEVAEQAGELTARAAARSEALAGSGTEQSTEDEWEKVSENENEKDK